ncbi:hypothetical protein scyTo_0020851, partial [Scyliorhinus torazame]|nr:hypothetical protein [Scyliorhinus torazame]
KKHVNLSREQERGPTYCQQAAPKRTGERRTQKQTAAPIKVGVEEDQDTDDTSEKSYPICGSRADWLHSEKNHCMLSQENRQSKDEYEREMAKRYATETEAKAGAAQSDMERAIVENAQEEEARLSRQHELGKENLQRAVQKSLQKRTSARDDAVASTSNLDEVVEVYASFLVFV